MISSKLISVSFSIKLEMSLSVQFMRCSFHFLPVSELAIVSLPYLPLKLKFVPSGSFLDIPATCQCIYLRDESTETGFCAATLR